MGRASPLLAGLIGVAWMLCGPAPAQAQYYPAPGYDPNQGGYYQPPAMPAYPPPGYPAPQPGYPPPGYGYEQPVQPGYGQPPYGGYQPPAPAPYQRRAVEAPPGQGLHCLTGRGQVCYTGIALPLRAPCRCDFGGERKRGVVVH